MFQFARGAQALAFAVLALASGCNPLRPPQEPSLKFDPALSRFPPEVAEASIQVLPAPNEHGNARLRVRFKQKPDSGALVIRNGARPTLLRDDGDGADERAGDGVFSAFVNFDAGAYEAELKRRAEIASKQREVPVFRNRELVGKKRLEAPRTVRFIPGEIFPLFPFDIDPFAVDPARELMITDVSVVEDPTRTYNPCNSTGTQMGAWTFGRLMTEMANQTATGINPSDFTLHWLQQWSTDLTINSFTVFQRLLGLNERILNPWPKLPDGRLDLAQAPFRLLAIVNRIDLRGSSAYGSSDAGEARLVFGLLRCNPLPPIKEAQEFMVIFEYGIKKSSCFGVRDWARQWHALGTIVLGTPAYNTALQAITDQFTLRDADPAKLPNRSALNQLRTNEFAIFQFPVDAFWELREFKICGDAGACVLGMLEETPVAQTPSHSFQFTTALRDFVNGHQAAILAGTHVVPLQLPPSTPFRAGSDEPGAGLGWDATGIADPEARHMFSKATCSGCHTEETGTSFKHISPRNAGSPAALSDFLTGLNQPKSDPVTNTPRTFHDLLDRQGKLDAAANMTCLLPDVFAVEDLFPPVFTPPGFPH